MRQINDAGLNLIKSFEGLRLMPYKDIAGYWTVGYGHKGNDIVPGETITQDDADQILENDLAHFQQGVTSLVTIDINDNQFAALVCFSYNLGLGSLQGSTLLSKLNSGDFTGSSDEFLKWDHAGGVEVPGLLRRRQAEQALFLS